MFRSAITTSGSLITIALILFFIASCVAEKSTRPGEIKESSAIKYPETPGKPAWEQGWERTIQEARKEGKVVIHVFAGISTTGRQEWAKIMKSRYGIELEQIAARATELAERIIREHRAGIYVADLYIGGLTSAVTRVKPGGVLEPVEPLLILPEVTDPKVWLGGGLPFLDKEKLILAFVAYPSGGLAINTSYVSREDLKSYRDLLNPRWKGKIVMSDPTIGGSGHMWFSVIGLEVMGLEYLKELTRQEIMFTRDLRLMTDWMAHGKYPIGIGTTSGLLVEAQRAGVPLYEYAPAEGSYLTSGGNNLAIYKKAPNPNATRVFINWLLSKEGQEVYTRGQDIQSARIDVPTDFLTPTSVRQPGMKYFDTRREEFLENSFKAHDIAREVFNIK